MAWQIPKTDWAPEDGVLDSDFNRIEGNIQFLYDRPAGLSANITVYVSTGGNDTTGNGSSATPYRTINKAISVIPRALNGYTASITFLTGGTYAEQISISGFYGGHLTFTASSNISITVTSISIAHSRYVSFSSRLSITITAGTAIFLTNGAIGRIDGVVTCPAVSGGIYGATLIYGSILNLSSISITGRHTGIEVADGSMVYVNAISGSSLHNVLSAAGGFIFYNTITATATNQFFTNAGGRIYNGYQTSTPRY